MPNAKLPILAVSDQILQAYDKYETLIILGETGSGKTTQIPKLIYQHESSNAPSSTTIKSKKHDLRIVVTQPRRVAAISLAKRVSQEMNSELGKLIGYSVRFEDVSSSETKIKYVTDGILLREFLGDSQLSRYSTVILDEAHERTLRTDILFGILRKIQKTRKLKIIIMSATMNIEKFMGFFENAFVFNIPGRQFPVQLFYTMEPQQDYLDSTILTIFQLHQEKASEEGDILVFLTGQEEIEALENLLNEYSPLCSADSLKMIVYPIHASLPSYMQMNVFKSIPKGCRKVILATNIAETSITIPGVKYVIDPGFAKIRLYNPKTGMETLAIRPISKSSARQRLGRAGREAPGECYRLFTESSYDELEAETLPEIMRTNLSNVILTMKAAGIDNVIHFDYLDCPPLDSIRKGLEELLALGALYSQDGKINQMGKLMAECPLLPQLSRILVESKNLHCTKEILGIISMLSVENIFRSAYKSSSTNNANHINNQTHPDEAIGSGDGNDSMVRKKYQHSTGDHLTLLNLWNGYEKITESKEKHNWCLSNFIDSKSMKQIAQIHQQLSQFCLANHMDVNVSSTDANILKCLVSGLFLQSAHLQSDGLSYKTVLGRKQAFIHPSSSMHKIKDKPNCIIYHELILTSKCYMRFVSSIDPQWINEYIIKNKNIQK